MYAYVFNLKSIFILTKESFLKQVSAVTYLKCEASQIKKNDGQIFNDTIKYKVFYMNVYEMQK